MTKDAKRKRATRAYAALHGLSYQQAHQILHEGKEAPAWGVSAPEGQGDGRRAKRT